MFYCWLSLHLVCFQFVCVLPFLGDFRSLFRVFLTLVLCFLTFLLCMTVILQLSFGWGVCFPVWFCCIVGLGYEKKRQCLCCACLSYLSPLILELFFGVFVSFIFCFFIELCLFYSFPLVSCSFWVWGIKVILLYPCLGLGERSWALTWGWLFFVCFVSFRVNAFLYVCLLFC